MDSQCFKREDFRYLQKQTPFYLYDMNILNKNLDACLMNTNKTHSHIHYALKANNNDKILKRIKERGFGADCVSGNEVLKALKIGFSPKSIVLAGVGKTDAEIEIAITKKIRFLVVESLPEIDVIGELAKKHNHIMPIVLRINPEVHAHTHSHITTGTKENKFGLALDELDESLALIERNSFLKFTGIHFHVGSQITQLDVFTNLCDKVKEVSRFFEERDKKIEIIDVGGGLGIDYQNPEILPPFKTYFDIFDKHLNINFSQELHFELGRSLVASCGRLITRVLFVKPREFKTFLIVDAGMTELIRPALYDAFHKIEKIDVTGESVETDTMQYSVVGPICESSDTFGEKVELPICKRGDLLSIDSAGAYGETLSSNYNMREKVKAYYIE